MKSFWIFGVFLLHSVVELEAARSSASCQHRILNVTADNVLKVYIDGIEITGLSNADNWNVPDIVGLACTTRLIAIHGRNADAESPAGVLASADDDYVLTNSAWKCSNLNYFGWEEIDFDDSTWLPAVEYGRNGNSNWTFVTGISSNAVWIWHKNMVSDAFCRKKLDPTYCTINIPCEFGGTCIDESEGGYQCICAPGYSGQNCTFVIDSCVSNPCVNEGTCLPIVNGYGCQCPPGYIGNNCESGSSGCDHNPCQNGGTCNLLGGDSYSCTCPIYATGVTCESPNYNEAYTCGTTLDWSQFNATNGFTRLCYFWTYLEDTEGRFNPCRNTIKGLPLYDDANGLLNAGGNFGCAVSQNYPEDILATRYLSCADNYQQDVYLGNTTESDRLMVCIRYPYEGLPDGK